MPVQSSEPAEGFPIEFTITVKYKSQADTASSRVVDVADAFGVGLDQFHEYTVYNDFRLRISPRDIVYIVGESGSGKSVLLRELERRLGSQNVMNISDVEVEPDVPLVEQVGKDTNEALELLSMVGLNDAFLFMRNYSQLSDGQKYRFKIAKMIQSGRQYWVADEMCASLDRDMAKIVAFNVQKLARRSGRAVLAATTHEDLFEDLAPSVYVKKGLGGDVRVRYFPNRLNTVCSVARDVHIEEGSREDYEKLAGFHYRDSRGLPLPIKFYTMKRNGQVIGVIVYSYPGVLAFGRYKAFGRRIPIKELNENFALISRVVLHPKYRSIGLGVKLVKETLPLVNKPFVETVAVMARYNPFFERAGLKKIAESVPDKTLIRAIEGLKRLGFNPTLMASERSNLLYLQGLGQREMEECRAALLGISSGYCKRLKASHRAYVKREEFRKFLEEASPEDLAKVLRRLAIIMQTKVYLLWRNPAFQQ